MDDKQSADLAFIDHLSADEWLLTVLTDGGIYRRFFDSRDQAEKWLRERWNVKEVI